MTDAEQKERKERWDLHEFLKKCIDTRAACKECDDVPQPGHLSIDTHFITKVVGMYCLFDEALDYMHEHGWELVTIFKIKRFLGRFNIAVSIVLTTLLEKKRREEERERRKREGLPEFTEAELADAAATLWLLELIFSWKFLSFLIVLGLSWYLWSKF